MALGIEIPQQGLVFLFTFTVTLVILSDPNFRGDARSVWRGVRSLMEMISGAVAEMISGRIDPPVENSPPRDRLSDETWRRVLQVHMINATPDRRM